MKISGTFVGLTTIFLFILSFILWTLNFILFAELTVLLSLFGLIVFFLKHPSLQKFAFTIWVFVFVTAALFFPEIFDTWAGFNMALLIVPLIQIIMFGMGTTLHIDDFTRVLKMPKPVLIGFVLQFTVMPLAAVLIASLFDFDAEISAGIILVGSCPGGVASNLMSYLAGGNVALSVTMTTSSTIVSPVMTPLLMQTFAGKYILIDFVEMMMSIFNMVIIPVVAGVFANKILYRPQGWIAEKRNQILMTILFIATGLLCIVIDPQAMGVFAPIKNGLVLGFLLLAIIIMVKYIMSHLLKKNNNWMDRTMTFIAMFGICFVLAIIISRSSDKLFSIGLALLAASVIHNFVGYLLGYWVARLLKLDIKDCRTIAFEVGMQNSGMASGLAINVLKSAVTALPPAIFGPWMNISGSVLASWWHTDNDDSLN
jgi:bile acid:Na+ symporter, BASS family